MLKGLVYEDKTPLREGYIDSRMWDPNWPFREDYTQMYRYLRLFLPDTQAMTAASADSYSWSYDVRISKLYKFINRAARKIEDRFREVWRRNIAAILIQRFLRRRFALRTYEGFTSQLSTPLASPSR